MSEIFAVDRIENGIATVVSDGGEVLNFPENELGALKVRDVFSADILDGRLINITPMPEEKERRLNYARNMLDKFKQRKKKSKEQL